MKTERNEYLRVAAAVPAVRPADVGANLAAIRALLRQVAAARVQVAVFPELCLTGYTCADLFYQRRFYRPDDRCWLNRDPIEERGGENLHAFCLNNPFVFFDELGNEPFSSIILKFNSQKTWVAAREFIKNEHSERDLYGHWWIEFDGESYGWWPSRPVGAWDVCRSDARKCVPLANGGDSS